MSLDNAIKRSITHNSHRTHPSHKLFSSGCPLLGHVTPAWYPKPVTVLDFLFLQWLIFHEPLIPFLSIRTGLISATVLYETKMKLITRYIRLETKMKTFTRKIGRVQEGSFFYVSTLKLFPSEYKWKTVMLYDPKNIGRSSQWMAAVVMLHWGGKSFRSHGYTNIRHSLPVIEVSWPTPRVFPV